MKYSAWKTWWEIARLGRGWRLNIRLANKAIRAGYRYTPGEWVAVSENTSIQIEPRTPTRMEQEARNDQPK